MALRSLAVPAVLGLRWAGRRGGEVHDEVPAPPRSLSLAAKMAVDELFLTVELVSAGFASLRERHRIESELRDALAFYEAQGWLERPEGFHRTPPPAAGVRQRPSSLGALAYRHLSFESGYAPHPGEPGRARWLSYGLREDLPGHRQRSTVQETGNMEHRRFHYRVRGAGCRDGR